MGKKAIPCLGGSRESLENFIVVEVKCLLTSDATALGAGNVLDREVRFMVMMRDEGVLLISDPDFTSEKGKATIPGKDQDVKAGDLIIVPACT